MRNAAHFDERRIFSDVSRIYPRFVPQFHERGVAAITLG
jgi:hypothetical protein